MPTVVSPPGSPPALSAHTSAVIGEWRLLRLLGVGSWFQVYQAAPVECTGLAADYAIKMPRSDRGPDDAAREMLHREVALGRQLCHPHVATVLASQLARPPYYIVMPYSAGGTVEQVLAACGRMTLPQALWVTRQIASGLSHIHERGFLHSDVKPANLFVTSTGHATLFDLGLARSLPLDQSSRTFAGTPNYAAPEWFATTLEVGAASDIYSLGLVLYEMLTGSAAELAAGHLLSDPRRIVPSIPRNVVRLLRKSLAPQPHQRPTASDLVDELIRLEVLTIDERCAP